MGIHDFSPVISGSGADVSPTLPLTDIPAAVEREIRAFFDANSKALSKIGPPVADSIAQLRTFVLSGGKRIRPTYGWVGFVGAKGLETTQEDPAAVLRAVSALEFIQACALIHDDIIDASDTRRGNPTVHRCIATAHRDAQWRGDPDSFGEHAAILIGDLALVWADDMWHNSGLSYAALARAAEPWRGMRSEVIGGQLLDIALEASGDESEELAQAVNRYKTAAYTIERPLHLGAALAGACEDTITALRGYGHDIGIAFQLRDDLLGVFGDPEVTGKPAGDDLREGKRTVLLSLALQATDADAPQDAERLRAGVGTDLSKPDIASLSQVIADSGAVEAVEQRITTLTESGIAHLETSGLAPKAVDELTTLAHKATARRM